MKDNSLANKRIWELDFLRGIALILMIYFHIIYDLNEMYSINVSYLSGVNYYIGKISAVLFMILSGISSSLSRSNVKRGLKVLGIAIVITIATHIYDPSFGIKFGILHFLGVCMLLYPLFSKLNKYLLIVIGIGVMILNNFVSKITLSLNILFPLGIYNNTFISSDYYPLIPWLCFFLFGIALGKFLYTQKQSLIPAKLKDNIMNKIGRNTLIIYLVHQPIIMAVLFLVDLIVDFS